MRPCRPPPPAPQFLNLLANVRDQLAVTQVGQGGAQFLAEMQHSAYGMNAAHSNAREAG
jgi:hypothetical protein